MCGIVVNIGKSLKKDTKDMLKRIKHRGPDNTSIIYLNNISIGFNRLSINDKSLNGNQPFKYKDYYGVFNGEIYNYKELINKFSHLLFLKSSSDMEPLLQLYDIMNLDFYKELIGMFAGLILDLSKNEIILIKDLTSQKPLFLVKYLNNEFSIVSELKSIVRQDIKKIINIKSGLTKLDLNANILEKKFHNLKWNLKLENPLINAQTLFNTISEVVYRHLPNEKFGVFLSGGLDSSIIAFLVSKYKKHNVLYYSLANENSEDYKYIKILTKFLNIPLSNLRIISLPNIKEINNILEEVIYYTESYNPSIISNGIATFLLSKKAKEDGLKVILSGEGADELFCGYKIFYPQKKFIDNWQELRKNLIDNLYFTESRRLDLCCMANSVEARSPFLDKRVLNLINVFNSLNCYSNNFEKFSLREAFKNYLPNEIINRKKLSFDKGSGIRSILKKYYIQEKIKYSEKISEKQIYKKIWLNIFKKEFNNYINYKYFHSYPKFNEVIENRMN